MATEGVFDPALGIPYYDVSFASQEIRSRFPFLQAPSASSFFPRIYAITVGAETSIDSNPSRQAPQLRVFPRCAIVTYDSLIVGDIDTGAIFHKINLTTDVVSLIVIENDPTRLGVSVASNVPGGDLFFECPVKKDATQLRTVIEAVIKAHTLADAAVKTVENADELREKLSLTPATPGQQVAMLSSVRVPQQLWSVANNFLPVVTDRMAYVKGKLSQIESDSQDALLSAKKDIEEARHSMDQRLASAELDQSNVAHEETLHKENCARIEAQERELIKVRADTESKMRDLEEMKVDFCTKEQEWQSVVEMNLNEELLQRSKLAKAQAEMGKEYEVREAEIDALRKDIEQLGEDYNQYDTEEYQELVAEREAAMADLHVRTKRLEHLQSQHITQEKRRLERSAEALLSSNEALRKHRVTVRETTAKKEVDLEALKDEIAETLANIHSLEEQHMICNGKEHEYRRQIAAVHSQIDQIMEEQDNIEHGIARRQEDSSPYVEKKALALRALNRRRVAEQRTAALRTSQRKKKMELQQEVFAESLRVDAATKSRVQDYY